MIYIWMKWSLVPLADPKFLWLVDGQNLDHKATVKQIISLDTKYLFTQGKSAWDEI